MTVLPNKENTVESLRRNFRSLAANSDPHPRYSDTEEIQIARIGSVHAAYPLFPLYPSDTRRERPDTGRDGGGVDCLGRGKPGVGWPNSGVKPGVMTETTTQHGLELTPSPLKCLKTWWS